MKTNNCFRRKRDEAIHDRLFFLLLSSKGITVEKAVYIKEHIILVHTNFGKKIVKGFDSKDQLLFQYLFLKKLRQRRGGAFINYESFPNRDFMFVYNHRYWGMMPYIAGEAFSFQKREDQKRAGVILQQFHKASLGITIPLEKITFRSLVDQYFLRLKLAMQIIPFLPRSYHNMFIEIINWGRYSLQALSVEPMHELEREALFQFQWIHGDLAEHNFIGNKNFGTLIDFDLVRVAPKAYDFLQLANRILTSNRWDIHEFVANLPFMEEFLARRWFPYALLFPSDLFREWYWWLVGRSPYLLKTLLKHTEQQFNFRHPLLNRWLHMLHLGKSIS